MAGASKYTSVKDSSPTAATPAQVSQESQTVPLSKTPSLGCPSPEKQGEAEDICQPSKKLKAEEATMGNPEFISSLKRSGMLGIFYDQNAIACTPEFVEIDVAAFRKFVHTTLTEVIRRHLLYVDRKKIPKNIEYCGELARKLVPGVCIALYQRLRFVNFLEYCCADCFSRKPKAPDQLMIPRPCAVALSKLGKFKVSGLTKELYVPPTIPEDAGRNFCIEDGTHWDPVTYAQVVGVAKK